MSKQTNYKRLFFVLVFLVLILMVFEYFLLYSLDVERHQKIKICDQFNRLANVTNSMEEIIYIYTKNNMTRIDLYECELLS